MDLLAALRTHRALCVVRARGIADPVGLTTTLAEAGLPIVEFALTTPGALDVIEQASTVDNAIVGAGTVLTAAQARDAVAAGARFLLTPGIRREVAAEAARLGVPVVLGALTPTEVADAMDAGATAVKVFPAARLGPAYFGDLRGPYPDIPLVATGGLTAATAADYLAAGALAVCAGSGVVSADLAASTDSRELFRRATDFHSAVRTAPSPKEPT